MKLNIENQTIEFEENELFTIYAALELYSKECNNEEFKLCYNKSEKIRKFIYEYFEPKK